MGWLFFIVTKVKKLEEMKLYLQKKMGGIETGGNFFYCISCYCHMEF